MYRPLPFDIPKRLEEGKSASQCLLCYVAGSLSTWPIQQNHLSIPARRPPHRNCSYHRLFDQQNLIKDSMCLLVLNVYGVPYMKQYTSIVSYTISIYTYLQKGTPHIQEFKFIFQYNIPISDSHV